MIIVLLSVFSFGGIILFSIYTKTKIPSQGVFVYKVKIKFVEKVKKEFKLWQFGKTF
jgi:hypothetical protein